MRTSVGRGVALGSAADRAGERQHEHAGHQLLVPGVERDEHDLRADGIGGDLEVLREVGGRPAGPAASIPQVVSWECNAFYPALGHAGCSGPSSSGAGGALSTSGGVTGMT